MLPIGEVINCLTANDRSQPRLDEGGDCSGRKTCPGTDIPLSRAQWSRQGSLFHDLWFFVKRTFALWKMADGKNKFPFCNRRALVEHDCVYRRTIVSRLMAHRRINF